MTVVAERVQAIGGFDQAHRRPRPLMRALPAGSIVYLDNQSIQAVETELCGFPGESLPDKQSGLDDELRRLQHAGFTMALSIGAKQER